MSRRLDRRRVIRDATLLVGALVFPRATAASASPGNPGGSRETSGWRKTGGVSCFGGQLHEQWCYYECVGPSCTIIQCEWRATGQPC